MVKHEIAELILQGAAKTTYFVKEYLLSYSDDGINFKHYTGTGTTKKVIYITIVTMNAKFIMKFLSVIKTYFASLLAYKLLD